MLSRLFVIAAAMLLAVPAIAAEPPSETAKGDGEMQLPPLPEDKTVRQSVEVGGRTIAYDATVGSLPVRDETGKIIGEVVYTAYIVPDGGPDRPVTFAFNGGPGASSVYLNLGAIGPKRVQFGDRGDSPSDPAIAVDNPYSWIDFTDLVFIDPIGTGFSRSLVDEEKTKAAFYTADSDIEYLSRIVFDWLVKAERLRSPKYLIGESYGGYRAPRMAEELQTQIGVGVNGLVLVSPYLDPAATGDDTALSPLPWAINLPSMAAASFEQRGMLSPAALAEVEAYARSDYITDLLRGPTDTAAQQRLVQRVSSYTGLDPEVVDDLDGRVDIGTFLRKTHAEEELIGSIYDPNVTAWDPFPGRAQRESGDPILNALVAPTTSAMVDFVTRVVGWETGARYHALSYAVNRAWERDDTDTPVTDLRKAIANDPEMMVMIAHGYNDLSCPYFGSQLIIDQMPDFGEGEPVTLGVYPGGHMYYSRPESAAAFKEDARALYARQGR